MSVKLFTPVELGGVTLPNRVVVSPMCQYSSIDGSAQDWHRVHYGALALSGAGLLCFEATHVERDGRITQGCAGLYSDENEAALKPIVEWARGWMPHVKLGIQLGHAGRKASAQRPWKGGGALTQADAPDLPWTTFSASAVPYDTKWHTPVALDTAGLKRVKAAFVASVERSARLGLDVIELHGAHGYLLHQFLSPLSNRRSDEYGGTMEKRRRFPLEVFEACRKAWPRDRALGVRLSATDWVEGGLTVEETIETARQLKALGCADALADRDRAGY
jgi:2,4-dienoyl-CoA reductase-like NADH-dependent reductase (Old Yellow Enzyme family)